MYMLHLASIKKGLNIPFLHGTAGYSSRQSFWGSTMQNPHPSLSQTGFSFQQFFNIRLVFLLQLNSTSLVSYIPKSY
jgi:hypothetical protein